MRILCVEDDTDSREVITILLEQAGYEVMTASSERDGLELARQNAFALIILDNWYEIGSGVELCKRIRRFDTGTPILFYSGAAYASDKQRAMEAGAQGYLVKPLGIGNILEIIKILTQRPDMQSNNYRSYAVEPKSTA